MRFSQLRATLVLLTMLVFSGAVDAQTYTDLFNFDNTHGASPQFPALLAQGRDGNLYGTTVGGGTGNNGVVFRVTPGGTLAVLYNFCSGCTAGELPHGGLTLGTDGNFYGSHGTEPQRFGLGLFDISRW